MLQSVVEDLKRLIFAAKWLPPGHHHLYINDVLNNEEQEQVK